MTSDLEIEEYPKFISPGNMLIFGPSKSGKSTFLHRLITNRNDVFTFTDGNSEFKSIIYYYGSRWQPLFHLISQEVPEIQFRMGYPRNPIAEEIGPEERPALVIFDDLEKEIESSQHAGNLFTRDSHHLGLYAVMVFQNIFPQGKNSTAIYRNADTVVYFRYGNNDHQLLTRFRNFYSRANQARDLMEVYKKWTERRGGYMIVDNHPDLHSKDKFTIRTNIFPEDMENLQSRVAMMNRKSVKRSRQSGQPYKHQKGSGIALTNNYVSEGSKKIYDQPMYFSRYGQPTYVRDSHYLRRLTNDSYRFKSYT